MEDSSKLRTEKCWICPMTFDSRRELKNHMIPAHGSMKVICVWCSEERTFKRVSDLRTHCKTTHQHKMASQPPDFLTENNCFWMSLNPSDYARLVKPTDWSSSVATQARVAVLVWVAACRNPSRRKEAWQKEWDARKRQRSPSVESTFEPVYEDLEDTSSGAYSPTRPAVDSLEILKIDLHPGNITVIFMFGDTYQIAILKDDVLLDPKSIASVSRKMAILPTQDIPKLTKKKFEGALSSMLRKKMAEKLGIRQDLFQRILTGQPETTERSAKKPRMQSPITADEAPSYPSMPTLSELLENDDNNTKFDTIIPKYSNKSISKLKLKSQSSTFRTTSPNQTKSNANKSTELKPNTATRAQNLLKRGCLPLFPPARREWAEHEVVLESFGCSVSWPPKGWNSMSPDRRLLAWEFTAMTFEENMRSGGAFIGIVDLLDKYNFLALPGTVEKAIKKTDQVRRKSRYYIYEQLKQIALGYDSGNDQDTWLKMLERSCAFRDSSTDHLVAKIDAANIHVRLSS